MSFNHASDWKEEIMALTLPSYSLYFLLLAAHHPVIIWLPLSQATFLLSDIHWVYFPKRKRNLLWDPIWTIVFSNWMLSSLKHARIYMLQIVSCYVFELFSDTPKGIPVPTPPPSFLHPRAKYGFNKYGSQVREAETDTSSQCSMGNVVIKMKEMRKYCLWNKMSVSKRPRAEFKLEEKTSVSSFIWLRKYLCRLSKGLKSFWSLSKIGV